MHHIKATLPDIKQKISSNLTKYEQELASLGGPQGEGSNVRVSFPSGAEPPLTFLFPHNRAT
jgi:hypothetical protein